MRLEPAEHGGAAVHQRIHDLLLLGREPMRPTVGIGALAQDVRDLQRRPGGRRCATGMRHRSGLAGLQELQQVQRGRRGRCLVVGQMQVAHGRADGAVPEPALNDVELDPGLEEPGGVAMPQRVDPAGLVDPGLVLGSILDVCGSRARHHRRAAEITGKQPVPGTMAAPVLAKFLEQPRREGDVAVLVALALIDAQTHPF